jgi:hypothetical protein
VLVSIVPLVGQHRVVMTKGHCTSIAPGVNRLEPSHTGMMRKAGEEEVEDVQCTKQSDFVTVKRMRQTGWGSLGPGDA